MNRNSLRNRPTPTAPASSAAAASPGSSMLASSSTRCAVQRDGRRVPQAVEPRALEFALALPEAVLLQHDRRRVDDHDAGVAVDDDPVVLADQAAGLARADHGRDVHAARDDGGVRGLAAHVGDEAREDAALELQHVGRRDVVGHQHQRVLAAEVARPRAGAGAHGAAPAPLRQRAQQALDHLLEVGLALAQVVVLHLVELPRQHLQLRRQRPLGVVVALADPVLGGAGQRLVVQQHQVHVEQRRQFGGRLGRQVALAARSVRRPRRRARRAGGRSRRSMRSASTK